MMFQINITPEMLSLFYEKSKIYSKEFCAILKKMVDEQLFCYTYQCLDVNCLTLSKSLQPTFAEKNFKTALQAQTSISKQKLFEL